MSYPIQTITLPLPMRMGSVNCFLVAGADGFVLFDTGGPNQRAELQQALEQAGCRPGTIKLIVLTHGDFDHSGNAAHLRQIYGAPIAMHPDDVGMVERGDMSWNRQGKKLILKTTGLLFGFGRAERFTPDSLLREGDDLAAYGLDAQVLHLPGHSLGSIGILLAGGDLIGGDLLENTKGPALNAIMDDRAAAAASVDTLKGRQVGTVYPGHGQPFAMTAFLSQR
jgi:glyoxylase-like metal-dependent hydrolase (beta-lactamase superfamily II)